MYFLLKMVIFHCHVSLPEGKSLFNNILTALGPLSFQVTVPKLMRIYGSLPPKQLAKKSSETKMWRMQPTQGDVPIENPQHCRLLRPMPQLWFCGYIFFVVLWPFGVVLDVESCLKQKLICGQVGL